MTDDRMVEIFTRAVAGRTKMRFDWVHTVPAGDVKNILGVHLGKTTVTATDEGEKASVTISVHCDIWCRDETETLVIQTTAESPFVVDVPIVGEIMGEREVQVSLADSPRSTGVKVVDGGIMLDLEVDVSLEVIGDVRLWVRTADLGGVAGQLAVPASPLSEPQEEGPAPEVEPARERGRSRTR